MDDVVEMLTGCGVVAVSGVAGVMASRMVVVVVAEAVAEAEAEAEAEAATRIQHRTPRLRPRAPSTPAELVISGFVMN